MSIPIEQQIGQLIIAGFRGMEVDPESNIAKYIQEYNIGGVIPVSYTHLTLPTKVTV